jgi:hypothetical protein
MTARYVVMVTGLIALLSTVPPLRAQQLQGAGEWQSATSDMIKGKWSVTLARNGGQVSGSLQLTGSNMFGTADVVGTVDQSNVMLGLLADGVAGTTFSGKLSGRSISGEWECPAAKDHGVWYGRLSDGTAADPATDSAGQAEEPQ